MPIDFKRFIDVHHIVHIVGLCVSRLKHGKRITDPSAVTNLFEQVKAIVRHAHRVDPIRCAMILLASWELFEPLQEKPEGRACSPSTEFPIRSIDEFAAYEASQNRTLHEQVDRCVPIDFARF